MTGSFALSIKILSSTYFFMEAKLMSEQLRMLSV